MSAEKALHQLEVPTESLAFIRPDRTYCFLLPVALSSEEPANTFRPSAKFTVRELQRLEPSFAKAPSIVTSSPSFTELRVQPSRRSTFGGPPSQAHSVTPPFASLTFR